jgi:MFS family permease
VAGALVPASSVAALAGALLLLGLGWSFGFVAASGLLARAAPVADRTRLQGTADTAVFAAAAAASLGSGVLVDVAGFAVLCAVAAALVAVPAVIVIRHRRAVADVPAPAS